MNKLLKLSDAHYIIVDDSEIKKGDFYAIPSDKEVWKRSPNSNIITIGSKKITYSFGKELEGVINKPLSEVEELVNGYDLITLSKEATKNKKFANGLHEEVVAQIYYRKGFKAHQELTKDKLFTINDMRKAFRAGSDWQEGGTILYPDEHGFIQSLLPKTEWDCEIDENGKINKDIMNEEIQKHIEKNYRNAHGEPMMDEEAFYEGAKWMRDQTLNTPVVMQLICPKCNCNKAYWNSLENSNECPCGHNWED